MHAFGVRSICPPLATHYTIKFGRCPILNKIHHEDTKGHEAATDGLAISGFTGDPFGRLRAGGIWAVEGASRVLRGNTLWIKAGCALSKRASSVPTRLAPATSSPCEAYSYYFKEEREKNTKIYWMGPGKCLAFGAKLRAKKGGKDLGRREEHEGHKRNNECRTEKYRIRLRLWLWRDRCRRGRPEKARTPLT